MSALYCRHYNTSLTLHCYLILFQYIYKKEAEFLTRKHTHGFLSPLDACRHGHSTGSNVLLYTLRIDSVSVYKQAPFFIRQHVWGQRFSVTLDGSRHVTALIQNSYHTLWIDSVSVYKRTFISKQWHTWRHYSFLSRLDSSRHISHSTGPYVVNWFCFSIQTSKVLYEKHTHGDNGFLSP